MSDMAYMYWMRLYYEILDDYKMYSLSDHLFRRTIELFLLAGEKNEKGILPPVEVIAWRLRTSPDDMQKDLDALEQVRIVHKEDENWIVTNYDKRQKPMPKKEYVRRKREDDIDYRQAQQGYKNWTTTEGKEKDMDFSNRDLTEPERALDQLKFMLIQQDKKSLIDRLEKCEVADDGKGGLLIIPDTKKNGEWLQARAMSLLEKQIKGINGYTSVEIVL